jgi:ATP-dependent DNA helicase RecG
MEKIERDWSVYNETQRKIFFYLFNHHKATLTEIVAFVQVNENSVRSYLNKFIEDELLFKQSSKQRDINALYMFKKL